MREQFLFCSFFLILFCACKTEPPQSTCRVNVANSSITISTNVSGGEGTHISPDIIDESSIQQESAEISFIVHRIGQCHEVVSYGHVWSDEFATPTVLNSDQSSYGSQVNFGDEVRTLMDFLYPNTKYFVRAYITIIGLEDGVEKTLYNDQISSFTTLAQCQENEINIVNDTDRQTVTSQDNGVSILSFEVVREELEECVNGLWEAQQGPDSKSVYIKNLISQTISCQYEIKYVLFNSDGTVFTEWTYNGTLTDIAPSEELKVYLNNNYGNIKSGVIEVSLSQILYK